MHFGGYATYWCVLFSVSYSGNEIYPSAGSFNLDHLVKVMPARFLYYDVTILQILKEYK